MKQESQIGRQGLKVEMKEADGIVWQKNKRGGGAKEKEGTKKPAGEEGQKERKGGETKERSRKIKHHRRSAFGLEKFLFQKFHSEREKEGKKRHRERGKEKGKRRGFEDALGFLSKVGERQKKEQKKRPSQRGKKTKSMTNHGGTNHGGTIECEGHIVRWARETTNTAERERERERESIRVRKGNCEG